MAKVRICPKCKSKNLQKESTRGMHEIGGVMPIYTCDDCGFSGSVFPEVEEESNS
jgi:hypothetical protein